MFPQFDVKPSGSRCILRRTRIGDPQREAFPNSTDELVDVPVPEVPVEPEDVPEPEVDELDGLLIVMLPEQSGFTEYVPVYWRAVRVAWTAAEDVPLVAVELAPELDVMMLPAPSNVRWPIIVTGWPRHFRKCRYRLCRWLCLFPYPSQPQQCSKRNHRCLVDSPPNRNCDKAPWSV
jgi:hypothetical protein